MQECDACGLLFGGSGECPSCGSRVSHAVVINADEDSGSKPSGPLPGESALADAKEGVQGLDITISSPKSEGAPSTLPFQVGGIGKVESNLPFGVGAPAATTSSDDDDEDVDRRRRFADADDDGVDDVARSVVTTRLRGANASSRPRRRSASVHRIRIHLRPSV